MHHAIDVLLPAVPSNRARDASTWQVAIHGVLDGHDAGPVLARMAALVKQEPARLRALLGAPGTVVKRGLDRATAETYRSSLVDIGCDCRIGREGAAYGPGPLPVAEGSPLDPWAALLAQAQGGDADAQFRVGMACARMEGIGGRDALAARWLEKAAGQGHATAAMVLVDCYRAGLGVPRNAGAALQWARIAADTGSPKGQYLLGRMLRRGEGAPADKMEAARWLLRSAEQGYAEAQYMVGYDYLTAGRQAPAALWLTRAADQGEPNAQACLGVMCLQGDGVERDPARGMTLLLKAAHQGIAAAQHNLGVTFAEGNGIAPDAQQALAWYRKAALQGYAPSEFELGMCYRLGNGVPPDLGRGHVLIRSAAEKGYAEAQFSFGALLLEGEGPLRADPNASAHWVRQAAAQGHAEARRIVGQMG